jgi:ParB-like chromosome segregation protein Spo0J
MVTIDIGDIVEHGPVDPTAHLDPATVERYADALDEMPPVVVFDTPEGRILVDGYHRVQAARSAGRTTIDADLRSGSRAEALRFAAEVGAAQRGISVDEAMRRILTRGSRSGGVEP